MHSHLKLKQRIELAVLLRSGASLRSASSIIGVHHTTLSRELSRNESSGKRSAKTSYHASDAHRKTVARRLIANQHFRKIISGSKLEAQIIRMLSIDKWAPEQIAGWLKATRRAMSVCAQTIYDWIYTYRRELVAYLHCRKGKYRRTGACKIRKAKRQVVESMRSIDNRPKRIELRRRYGDWEGDTVHGVGKSGYIATFVERKSGYLLACKLESTSSLGFADAAAMCFSSIPSNYQRTLTLDNGPEMKSPERIERTTKLKVYYAHPYHSWERGTNENTNGLLRYFFPKKSSFATLTQKDIDQAVRLLNTRPRKRLGYRTPAQMLKV
jgi:transposase, IS30 family